MELKIETRQEEPLLSRTKIIANITFDKATPSYKDLIPQIASSVKKEESLVIIRRMKNYFGSRKAQVLAYAYNDENSRNVIEPKKKEKKAKEAKPKAEKKG